MIQSINKRLRALEGKLRPSPLYVLAELPSGEQIEVRAADCIAQGLPFVKVSRGGNLADLDNLLAYMLKACTTEELHDLADGTPRGEELAADICERLNLPEEGAGELHKHNTQS